MYLIISTNLMGTTYIRISVSTSTYAWYQASAASATGSLTPSFLHKKPVFAHIADILVQRKKTDMINLCVHLPQIIIYLKHRRTILWP